ncbi:hypothetical protein CBS101457_005878 [Exobasidium rhododendri]|nr:hypothetical protein CBS101457_005878 [Exobasidium rhododendri]
MEHQSKASTSASVIQREEEEVAETIFEITTGFHPRKAIIYLPLTYPDRKDVAEKIIRHGGQVASNPNNADIALVDEEERVMDKVGRVYKRFSEGTAGVVTEKWLNDSISRGEMQHRYDLYRPARLDRSQEIERLEQHRSIAPKKRRVMRSESCYAYTAVDEQRIIRYLANTARPWRPHRISKELETLFPSRSAGSYASHLRDNLYINKNYEVQVLNYIERQGASKAGRSEARKSHNAPHRPSLKAPPLSASQASRSVGGAMPAKKRKLAKPETSGMPLRRDATMQVDECIPKSSDQGTTTNDDNNREVIGMVEKSDAALLDRILSSPKASSKLIEAIQHQLPLSNSNAADGGSSPPSPLRFNVEHSQVFIEKLSEWFKSKFEKAPSSSSQESKTLGYICGSQDSICPPEELFVEMSTLVSGCSAHDWHSHFEFSSNKMAYLQFAKEKLEGLMVSDDEGGEKVDTSPFVVCNESKSLESELEEEETDVQMGTFSAGADKPIISSLDTDQWRSQDPNSNIGESLSMEKASDIDPDLLRDGEDEADADMGCGSSLEESDDLSLKEVLVVGEQDVVEVDELEWSSDEEQQQDTEGTVVARMITTTVLEDDAQGRLSSMESGHGPAVAADEDDGFTILTTMRQFEPYIEVYCSEESPYQALLRRNRRAQQRLEGRRLPRTSRNGSLSKGRSRVPVVEESSPSELETDKGCTTAAVKRERSDSIDDVIAARMRTQMPGFDVDSDQESSREEVDAKDEESRRRSESLDGEERRSEEISSHRIRIQMLVDKYQVSWSKAQQYLNTAKGDYESADAFLSISR